MQPQKFLKILVIGLGVAIVLALGMVVYGVARLSKTVDTPSVAAAPKDTDVTGTVEVSDLNQPVGTEIEHILPLSNGRVAVVLKGGAVPDRIGIVDLKTGKLMSTIYTTPPARSTP